MKRRWVYLETEPGKIEAVEVTADFQPTPRIQLSLDSHYDGLRATDGTDIGSRRRHLEYMKSHGLAMADDFKETWAKKAAERERVAQVAQTGRPTYEGTKARREDVGRALYQLQHRRRK